ncbi:MAG: YceI family protein [candidate division Zixibacteria bacterium]|jgi:polyisoprenoid-binding protein YceI|nr:YceI family protein [candidate division Zixibacteria bacterium]
MLKHVLPAIVGTGVIAASAVAADWKLDVTHSEVGFTVRHMVVSKVNGQFTEFDGVITGFDGTTLEGGAVTFTAKSASINTDNVDRDKHLKSPDFFAVEEHPELKFVSTKVVPGEGNRFQLMGDLTIRGVTKPVTFDCEFNGVVTDPWGNTRAGFSATADINRQDFGVSWSKSLDAGGLVVSDNVQINIEIEAVQAKEG